jgi:hypothetical protein
MTTKLRPDAPNRHDRRAQVAWQRSHAQRLKAYKIKKNLADMADLRRKAVERKQAKAHARAIARKEKSNER